MKLAHAVLIDGGGYEQRYGKAIELLKGHFSDDPAAAEKLSLGIFEDLHILEPEEGKEIKVKAVTDLIELFMQKPFASTGRACVITHGERMNEHAQNKLLKLLEEPVAGYVIMILTAKAEMLLPTVRSRCMRVWLGYPLSARSPVTEDIRSLTAALVYGKGTCTGAGLILSRYEGSREEAAEFLGEFQLFLRSVSVGRHVPELIDAGAGRESAAKIQDRYADRMRAGVLLAEKALNDMERGYRVRYALRAFALSMRAGVKTV